MKLSYPHLFDPHPLSKIITVAFMENHPLYMFDLVKIEAIEKEFDDAELFETHDGAEDEWDFAESDSGLKEYEVANELKNKRIDAILSTLEHGMSRSQCGSLITNGMVTIQMGNKKRAW